jgi:hypothetical protein
MQNDDGRGRDDLRRSRACEIAKERQRALLRRDPIELYKFSRPYPH